MLAEELGKITKRLDELDEKIDTYYSETIQLKTDISWIKGSAKLGITVVLALLGGAASLIIKLIPAMNGQ